MTVGPHQLRFIVRTIRSILAEYWAYRAEGSRAISSRPTLKLRAVQILARKALRPAKAGEFRVCVASVHSKTINVIPAR